MKKLINKKNLQLLNEFCDFSIFHAKNILITGGTGMVGSYLVDAIVLGCQEQGYRPSKLRIGGLQVSESSRKKFIDLSYVEMSSSYLVQKNASGDNQIVFHLASPASPTQITDYDSLQFVNSGCLENILNPYVEKFVFFSTGEVYGNKPKQVLENDEHANFDVSNKRDWYPKAKLEGEGKSKELCALFDIDLAIIRLFHTFGPGIKRNDGRSFADFLYEAAIGNLPVLRSKGTDIRTFLFSTDAVIAFIKIFAKPEKVGVYNVGSAEPITIAQFAKKVSEIAGLGGEIEFNFRSNEDYLHSPNRSIIPNISRLLDLGWKSRIDLDSAILETLQYIKS